MFQVTSFLMLSIVVFICAVLLLPLDLVYITVHIRVYMRDYGVFSWLPRWAYDCDYEPYHHFKDDAESHTTLASIL